MQHRTIKSVLYDKFLDTLTRASWRDMLLFVARCILAIVLSSSLVFMSETLEIAKFAWFYGDFMLPKICLCFVLVFSWKYIDWSWIETFSQSREEVDLIEGIPIVELADYVLEEKSFRRLEVMKRFGIPRSRFDFLSDGFDTVGIFVRGPNNSRVLSEEWGRGDIISILSDVAKHGEFSCLMREVPGGYSSLPSFAGSGFSVSAIKPSK